MYSKQLFTFYLLCCVFNVCSKNDRLEYRGLSAHENQYAPHVYGEHADEQEYTFLISGGMRTKISRDVVKYMVSIRTRKPQKYFGDNHFCSGVIIDSNAVLTAANCLVNNRNVFRALRRTLIVAGTPNRLDLVRTTFRTPLRKYIVHPMFTQNHTRDLAIIWTKYHFPRNNSAIKVKALPKHPFFEQSYCLVVGWGRLYYRGPMSARALTLYLSVTTARECTRLANFGTHEGTICASESVLTYKNPCSRDAGGPLICDNKLVGIISYTIGCGSYRIPSLFSDVYNNLDWIQEQLARGIATNLMPIVLNVFLIVIGQHLWN